MAPAKSVTHKKASLALSNMDFLIFTFLDNYLFWWCRTFF